MSSLMKIKPKTTIAVVSKSVRVIWLPKVFNARSLWPAPSALEIMEEPPIPMAIPSAAIKNETGSTTLIAAMAMEPIQLPTKMVSTKMFSDITKIPIEAGTACLISKLPIESVPNAADLLFILYYYYLFPEILVNYQNRLCTAIKNSNS